MYEAIKTACVVSQGHGEKEGGRKVSANLGRLMKGSGVSIQDTHTVLKEGGFTTHAHRCIREGQRCRQVIGPLDVCQC